MPNTKSAAKRVRGSARKAAQNRKVKFKVKGAEKEFLSLIEQGKVDEAAKALPKVVSAYDRAAKTGALKKEKAGRKHSRLARRLNAAAAKPAKPAAAAKSAS